MRVLAHARVRARARVCMSVCPVEVKSINRLAGVRSAGRSRHPRFARNAVMTGGRVVERHLSMSDRRSDRIGLFNPSPPLRNYGTNPLIADSIRIRDRERMSIKRDGRDVEGGGHLVCSAYLNTLKTGSPYRHADDLRGERHNVMNIIAE